MQVFYSTNNNNSYLSLTDEEAKHCAQVLRKNVGDIIHVIDGKGWFFEGRIESISKKEVNVLVLKKEIEEELPLYIHIAIAPPKQGEKFEWFIQKATEIGISEISPIYTEHSERRKLRMDRMEKILISAIKQSKRARLPRLNEPQKFSDFMERNLQGPKMIGFCEAEHNKTMAYQYDQAKVKEAKKAHVLIGPEGDFSPAEINLAKENDFLEISFGNMRLKTETAGIIACHSLHLLSEIK